MACVVCMYGKIRLHFVLSLVLPSAEFIQSEIQVAPDGDPTSEQPGGTLPSPQLPQPGQLQVRHNNLTLFPLSYVVETMATSSSL